VPRFTRLRSLPLRSKVILTVVGGTAVVLGVATYLSFRYWERESLAAAEQQALLAATATRSTLESAFRLGREAAVRRHLLDLSEQAPILTARVFASRGEVLYSATPGEEGRTQPNVWIPDASSLPREGVVHPDPGADVVRVFLPLSAANASLLEVDVSVAPLRSAMRRGARLGLGLVFGSVVALGLIVGAMLEREVVTPLQRVGETLAARAGEGGEAPGGRRRDEVRGIERSLERLLEREREAEVRAAEREGLAEVGELAAEMAHEFKRPLASIRSALDVLQQEYRLDEGGREVMTAVNEQLVRLTDTMQDLFSLARPVMIEAERVSITDVLDDALLEFAGQPGAGRIQVVRDYDPEVPAVRGDERRLRQALANLMVNALEAMPEGGTLTLSARPEGTHGIQVTVRDTGVGIDPGEIERAFRPFYSTKPLGTGLGLPLVARVVVAHRGRIGVDSRPGAGTSVTLHLPSAEAPMDGPAEGDAWPTSAFSSSTTTP
jgi:signal transduction histidine kinase